MSGSENTEKTKKSELEKKIRTKMFFVGIVCLTVVLMVIANSLAWFNNRKDAHVGGIQSTIQDVPTILIREYPSGGEWFSALEESFFPMSAICGDGNRFFKPVKGRVTWQQNEFFTTERIIMSGATEFAPGETIASHAFVKEFEIKTNISYRRIYLSADSYIQPDYDNPTPSEVNSSALDANNIAGALRVAFYQWVGEGITGPNIRDGYQLTAVWIPNPGAELINSGGIWQIASSSVEYADGKAVYSYGGQPEEKLVLVNAPGAFSAQEITNAGIVYDSDTLTTIPYYDRGYVRLNGVLYFWDAAKAIEAGQYLFEGFEINAPQRFRTIVWVDGTDRECENALMGGKMKMNIALTQDQVPMEEEEAQ